LSPPLRYVAISSSYAASSKNDVDVMNDSVIE
jgi:hypothetical protein